MNRRRICALIGGVALCAASIVTEAIAQARPFSGIAPKRPINTRRELADAFYACFKLPPPAQSRPGMTVSFLFAITKSGELQGEPRFTFVTAEAPPEMRAVYQRATVDALKLCTPFPLTESFGNAVAGTPVGFTITDPRGQRKA